MLRILISQNPLIPFATLHLAWSYLYFSWGFSSIAFFILSSPLMALLPFKQRMLAFLSLFCYAIYLLAFYHAPLTPSSEGACTLKIVQLEEKALSKKAYARAFVKEFSTNNKNHRGFYASCFLPKGKGELGALYQGVVQVEKKGFLRYQIHGDLKKIASPDLYTFYRQKLHSKVKKLLFSLPFSSTIKDIFLALSTGEMRGDMTIYMMKQFGLLHLLAISGLHFGLIANFINFFLSPLKHPHRKTQILGLFMTCYFLFIGPSPSVMRAFISVSLSLIAFYKSWSTRPLNFLCFSLILALYYSPYFIYSIGFQFSYLITLGILTGYSPMKGLSNLVVGPLIPSEHGFMKRVKELLNDSFALSLSVSLTALPLTLFHFQSFPLASIYYNLVFPLLFSLTLYLLISALLIYPLVPSLSLGLLHCNHNYTQGLVFLLEHAPSSHELSFHLTLPYPWMAWGMTSFILIGFLWIDKKLNPPASYTQIWL